MVNGNLILLISRMNVNKRKNKGGMLNQDRKRRTCGSIYYKYFNCIRGLRVFSAFEPTEPQRPQTNQKGAGELLEGRRLAQAENTCIKYSPESLSRARNHANGVRKNSSIRSCADSRLSRFFAHFYIPPEYIYLSIIYLTLLY